MARVARAEMMKVTGFILAVVERDEFSKTRIKGL
jgi:hypothetical protein